MVDDEQINEQKDGQRLTRSGLPLFDGTDGKRFSSEYQPSPEAKSLGAKKRWTLKALLNQSVGSKFDGSQKDYRALTATYMGIPEDEVTIRMVMEFRQIEKAILKGDTQAFNAVLDRTDGKPKQQQDEPPPPVIGNTDEEQKSKFDLGGGIVFDV